MSAPVRILKFRPLRKSSLLGFANVQFPSGIIISEVGVHRLGERVWCSPPSRPWVRNGAVVTDEASGKIRYEPVISFANHGVRRRWSEQIVAALEAHDPAIFKEDAPE